MQVAGLIRASAERLSSGQMNSRNDQQIIQRQFQGLPDRQDLLGGGQRGMELVRPLLTILDRVPLLPLPDRGPVEPVQVGERAHAKEEVRISSRIAGVVHAHGCRRMTMGEAPESAGPRALIAAAWATGNTGWPFAQAADDVVSHRPGHEHHSSQAHNLTTPDSKQG
jgi:hypothetical protein